MFVTFEGVEGAGKTTQMALAESWLRGSGRDVLTTRQPGGCPLGLTLRRILLDARNTHIEPAAELFMYLADRAQHVSEVIRPALDRGAVVLCDRFHDSTVAYQGFGRGLDVEKLDMLGHMATEGLKPNLTIVLDIPPEEGLARARGRNKASGSDQSEGRFEALDLDFHTRVRDGFITLAAREPERFEVIDAREAPPVIFAKVREAMQARLG